jgi:hypothetical protein
VQMCRCAGAESPTAIFKLYARQRYLRRKGELFATFQMEVIITRITEYFMQKFKMLSTLQTFTVQINYNKDN